MKQVIEMVGKIFVLRTNLEIPYFLELKIAKGEKIKVIKQHVLQPEYVVIKHIQKDQTWGVRLSDLVKSI